MSVRELTRQLVATPSHDDETTAGDRIESWLAEHTDAALARDGAGNVVARRNTGADTSLALVGHHDVVEPDDSQREDGEYVLQERDGRLYGRGAADMKGSLAAAMVAFADADPACELVFASFVGEESGGVGCRAAIEDGFAPDYAVVGEGSTGYSAEGVTDVAVAHKGRRGATVVAAGTAAHASEPEAGENAIYRATEAVSLVRSAAVPGATVLGHDLEGSVVVTEIEGGSAWNVVPERCAFTVDERTVPGERADLGAVESVPGVSLEVDQDLPPMACDDGEFADAVLSAADAAQAGTPESVVKPHATDAGWLAGRAGTTTVVCGAAEPGEAHTADESVSFEVVERCAEIYRRVAETWG
ncbi:M20 family metallopeptidase [Natronomonas marina]|jgi:acetylornithine deacetylase|uniref:M20 family metallopeptidase n=1 Tax=Natronomonas marina TaxID=2961939 RepID=UPI0020C96055|nr:M20/M25/M40 family metallo-hydrolase [Natronomonas marina]